jgi:hypothetical protein
MLDDCKGERLEEILAVFSNAVLKKVQTAGKENARPIALQLALENFSYSGERTALSTFILAHKASLHRHLREKEDADARYRDFTDLLNLNDRRIARRLEQLKQTTEERGPPSTLSAGDISALQDQVKNNWSGREEWLESILYGDTRVRGEGLLAAKFDSVWRHVEDGSIGDVEEKRQIGLLEQLDARVRSQEVRLARWQDFGKTLSKSGAAASTQKKDAAASSRRIELGFNLHEGLQVNHSSPSEIVEATAHASLKEYTQLIEDMKAKLADVGKAPAPEKLASENLIPDESSPIAVSVVEKDESPPSDDEWSSASNIDETPTDETPTGGNSLTKKLPTSLEIDTCRGYLPNKSSIAPTEDQNVGAIELNTAPQVAVHESSQKTRAPSPQHRRSRTPPPYPFLEPSQSVDSESDLADQILHSVSASSPSPKKVRHTLSLAERTRLSMSRATHSQYSDLHEDSDHVADLPRLSAKPRSQSKNSGSPDEERHADLIQRTRQSMAGFEAAQKRAQVERRRSAKDAKKRSRESSYFPALDEEPRPASIDTVGLIEDPDYESVFKSRPKIKTSPAASPTKGWE